MRCDLHQIVAAAKTLNKLADAQLREAARELLERDAIEVEYRVIEKPTKPAADS